MASFFSPLIMENKNPEIGGDIYERKRHNRSCYCVDNFSIFIKGGV